MISPTKYLDLESSVIRLAAFILEELKREPIIRLAELASRVDEYASGKGRFNFFPSLNVLFLTGQIEYSDDDDVIVRRNVVPARGA